jgi:hypothetical protein
MSMDEECMNAMSVTKERMGDENIFEDYMCEEGDEEEDEGKGREGEGAEKLLLTSFVEEIRRKVVRIPFPFPFNLSFIDCIRFTLLVVAHEVLFHE